MSLLLLLITSSPPPPPPQQPVRVRWSSSGWLLSEEQKEQKELQERLHPSCALLYIKAAIKAPPATRRPGWETVTMTTAGRLQQ